MTSNPSTTYPHNKSSPPITPVRFISKDLVDLLSLPPMRMYTRTAIVLFSLSPEKEVERKPILGPYERALNLGLFREMQDTAINSAKGTNIPFFHFDEKQQRGEDFGERFCNVIEDVFGYGYENVVLIGNDNPDVNAAMLTNAALGIETGQAIMSLTQYGGFSCLGISRSHYKRADFLRVRWQTGHAGADMLKVLGEPNCKLIGSTVEIETREDILQYLEESVAYSGFYAFALSLFSPFRTEMPDMEQEQSSPLLESLRFRGPPHKA